MTAPIASILCGVLPPAIIGGSQPQVFLDVATGPDASPTLSVDVTANDPVQGNITSPVITSGPAGGSVSVVGNQIVLTHNGAGVYVIGYTSTVGALSDSGVLTAVITGSTVAGSPPSIAPTTYQLGEGGNFTSGTLTIPGGTPLPANTRALVLGIGAWSGAFGLPEPQTINALAVDYAGNAMTRLDSFGNDFYIGNDGSATGVGPAVYTFVLLSTSGFSIPTSGNINWAFTTSNGDAELFAVAAIPVTHPSRDLLASELSIVRTIGNTLSSTVAATASDNAALVNFSIHKRQVIPTSDPNWTEEERVIVDNAADIQSGRLLAETRVFTTGGNGDHITTSDQANLHGSITVQLADSAGGVAPPTALTLNASANAAGSQITVDMSAAGAPITAVKVRSPGEGAATFSGTNLQFTPPITDQTVVVDVAHGNTGGAVISTVTITVETVSVAQFGPSVGPAVGLGVTGTRALQPLIDNLVATQIRPALEAANNRNLTDAQIRAANPGANELFGTTGTDFVNAMNAGGTVLLRGDRTYNLNFGNNQASPGGGVKIVGLNGTDVILGGTPKNAGQTRILIRGDIEIEGVNFRDGAILLSANGLTSTVNNVSVRNCTFNNTANIVHHELNGGVSDQLVINNLTVKNNICTNVRDGVNMRLGQGLGFAIGTVVRAEICDNIVDGWSRYGIALHYDTPPSGFAYNAASTCQIKGNLITNADTPVGNSFMIATAAFQEDLVEENWIINNSRFGTGVDHEAIYTKAQRGTWRNNVISQSGQNDFQGILGLKGEDAASPDTHGELEIHNNLIFSDQADTTGVFFLQRDNVNIHNNLVVLAQATVVFSMQSSSPFSGLQFRENLIRDDTTSSFGAVGLGGDATDFTFADNQWEFYSSATRTIYTLRSSTTGSRELTNINISGDTFKAFGSGNYLAVFVEERTAAIINPSITNGQFENWPRALVVDGNPTTLTWTGHNHTGSTPATAVNGGSTVNTLGSGGGNSF